MTLYRYKGLCAKGKKISGIVEAENSEQATETLDAQKIVLLELKKIIKKNVVPKTSVVLFTQELSRLLKAGMALYEALQIMEEKYRRTKTHSLFLTLLEKIRRGEKLSKAIIGEPVFSPLYRSMIQNAEKTGSLITSLEELYLLLSKQEKLKKQIVSALIYPGILLAFCCLVFIGLLYYVVPSLSELFQGAQLHPMTKFVLFLSKFAIEHQVHLLLTISVIMGISFLGITLEKTRKKFMQLFMTFPLVKSLLYHMSLVRFSRALASLLKGGVSFVSAVHLSKEVITHVGLQKKINRVEEGLTEGKKFSLLLSQIHFPPLFTRLVAIAEESGKMDVMLNQIAHIYEEEVEKTLTRITSILQPALLILLGLIVGFVLLSVLLPLTDMNSFM